MPGPERQSDRDRNKAETRRKWVKAEQYLTQVEKVHGTAKAWELRERLERGDVSLSELTRR